MTTIHFFPHFHIVWAWIDIPLLLIAAGFTWLLHRAETETPGA